MIVLMDEAKFKKILKHALLEIDEIKKLENGSLRFDDINSDDLDIGQKEILRRIEFSVSDYHKEYESHDCEACRDLWGSDIRFAIDTINNYLNFKLTNAVNILTVSYMKTDRSTSQTIFIIIKNSRPVVVSFKNDLSSAVQDKIKSHKINDLKDLKLPQRVLDYELMPEKSYRVAFAEELIN